MHGAADKFRWKADYQLISKASKTKSSLNNHWHIVAFKVASLLDRLWGRRFRLALLLRAANIIRPLHPQK